MLESDLRCIECRIEAVCWRMSRHNHHRTLTVTSVESLIEVSLLCLCRDTCRWTGTLNVNDYERKLCHNCKTQSLRLEGKTRT